MVFRKYRIGACPHSHPILCS